MKQKSLIAFVAALVWLTPAMAATVHEYALDNGMKILIKEDHRAPVVVSQVWYGVGSAYEPMGTTGMSHVLEHMMFKGTEKHGPGEFSRVIAAHGGQENAFTSRDYTAYYQQLEKSRLPISFEMEADRMRNLRLTAEEFAKEVNVVMEERRLRVEDDPQSIAVEQFFATAFVNNPYRIPVIGWMEDLQQMTVEDLRHWYQTWYAPNNATLVVVGDVEPKEVLELAKKYYGPLKPSNVPPVKSRPEIKQRGTKRITVKVPAELPFVIMGYHVPTLKTAAEDWEPYALEVLSAVLDDGDSARFANELIRGQQIAASADAGYSLYSRFSNTFTLDGVPTPGHTIAELEQALRDQVKKIQDAPPSADELARVKAQVVARDVYERDSVFYQAMRLGSLTTMGLDWKVLDEYVDRIRAITPEQVQQVAQKYLTDDQLTIAILEPLPLSQMASVPQRSTGGAHVH